MKLPSFLRTFVAPAVSERDGRIKTFRAEIEAARASGDRARLEALLQRPAQLGLDEDEVALELEHVSGLLEARALAERLARGEPLEVIETGHRAIAGERCYFVAPASFPDALMDQGGKLFVTDRRLFYMGGTSRSAGWAQVTEVRDDERDVLLTVRPLDLLRFRCNSYVDALRVAELARHLSAQKGLRRS